MSLCVVDGKHCSCQPEDGCPCPGVEAQRRKIEQYEKQLRACHACCCGKCSVDIEALLPDTKID